MDGQYTAGMQAAMDLVRSYTGHGSPDLASEILNAVSDVDDGILSVLLSEGAVKMKTEALEPEISDAVRGFVSEHGSRATSVPERISFIIEETEFGFLTCDADADTSELHGIIIHHSNGSDMFGRRRMVVCEAALFAAMRTIISNARSGDLRWNIELRGFLNEMGVVERGVSRESVLAPWGLRKHRLDRPRDALRALGAVMGLYKRFDRVPGMNIDLGGKSARIKVLEESSPLRRCFDKVEFNNMVSNEEAEEIGRCFSELLSSGILPRIPEGFHAAIRFRRYSNVKIENIRSSAWYSPSFRTIVVNSDNPGTFVHEYAHLLDHAFGYPSEGIFFTMIYQCYCSEVRRAFGKDLFDSRYYFRKQEVFARCFEIYVMRHHQECTLIDKTAMDRRPYPDSDLLGTLVDMYFSDIWEDGRTAGYDLRTIRFFEEITGIGSMRE